MGAGHTPGSASRADALAAFADEGCTAPRSWSNEAGVRFERHEHPQHKVLFCLAGSITFHTDAGDLELRAGDRLDLEPGTPHGAAVGASGCACVEAWRP